MEGKPGGARLDAPAKPVRRSLKAIESNIVNRRTQLFESTPTGGDPKKRKSISPSRPAPSPPNQRPRSRISPQRPAPSAPSPPRAASASSAPNAASARSAPSASNAPPQRPAPPKLPTRPASNTTTDVNKEIAKEFTQKVAQRKTVFQDHKDSAEKQKQEETKTPPTVTPQKPPAKPKPPKPETKPRPLPADRGRAASDSVLPDTRSADPTSNAISQKQKLTDSKSVNLPTPKPRPTSKGPDPPPPKPTVTEPYSAVDKSKKTQGRATKSESSTDELTQAKPDQAKPESGPASPPVKPPRTFEHDEYLKRKTLKKALKHKSGPLKPGHDISDGLREEPEEAAAADAIFEGVRFHVGKTDTSSSKDSNHHYEEVGDPKHHIYEEIGNKRLSGDGQKPNPPPRPPNPKVSTLSRNKPNTPLRPPITKTQVTDPSATISKKNLANPSYARDHDIIPIRTIFHKAAGAGDGTLKRARSDECLYDSKMDLKAAGCDSDEDPVYQDPVDVVPRRPHVHKGVVIDAEGYAIPDTGRHTLGRQWSNLMSGKSRRITLSTTSFRKRGPSMRNKVSEAYSILRRRPKPDEGGDAGKQPMQFVEDEGDDTDSDVDMEEHKKKLEHIHSVRGQHHPALKWTYATPVEARPKQLFDLGLIVTVKKDADTNKFKPSVIFSFPDNAVHQPNTVADFCFPDASSLRPVTKLESETYSFILTTVDGTKHYGYCRRYLPPGSGNRLPEVCCLVSPFGSYTFYKQLVEKLEEKRRESLDNCRSLVQAAYGRPLPDPGQEAWIRCHSADDNKQETVIMRRPADCKLERVSFSKLLDHMSVSVLIKVFSAVVLERRLLFTAQYLSTLSNCIHAISALLYPFEWQHTYVPVLPPHMLGVVCAPTPYIIGMLSTSLPDIQDLPMDDEVLIVDLDTSHLYRSKGDEGSILPKKLQKALTAALKADPDLGGSKDTMVFEAFLRLFVETTGHHTEYICTQQDGQSVFEKELFCKAVSSKSIRLFLEWFTETQMFEEFIARKVEQDKSHTTDTYDRRVMEYREEMKEMGTSLSKNVRQLGRRMINFVMESGGKIKKAFVSTDSNVFV